MTVNGTLRTFYSAFLSNVQVEGWGQTKSADCIGYDNGAYTASAFPRDSLDEPLRVGGVAVDFAAIQAGTNITIPTLPALWSTTRFMADDSGPDIVGSHVDVYTGRGLAAEQETYRITSSNQTVCAFRLVVGAPTAWSISIARSVTTDNDPGVDRKDVVPSHHQRVDLHLLDLRILHDYS